MKYFLGSILSAEGGMHCPGVSNKYMKTNESSLDPLVILVELMVGCSPISIGPMEARSKRT